MTPHDLRHLTGIGHAASAPAAAIIALVPMEDEIDRTRTVAAQYPAYTQKNSSGHGSAIFHSATPLTTFFMLTVSPPLVLIQSLIGSG